MQDRHHSSSIALPLDRDTIARLLPHSGRMCLLESVLDYNATSISCTASNHRNIENPLRRDGRLPITAGIEYAAQAMALHASLQNHSGEMRGAMLVQLSNINWHRDSLDDCGATLLIQAEQVNALGNAANYRFALLDAKTTLIEGNMLVHLDAALEQPLPHNEP